ncbi:ADP-ribosylglycohydrolase family protein [Paenibacillus profundus]|nr:ADP-ribosylglycohydrolase family protein [Paenibacillus profundus]
MDKVQAGILGLCVGDALGVPAEFRSRKALIAEPIVEMIGYGSHGQPPGTWSDDSSLTFCLMESIIECKGINLFNIADKFTIWLWRGHWAPHGEVFDVGIATRKAIERINDEFIRPDLAGGKDEFSNGNGSLMRILPLAFYVRNEPLQSRVVTVSQVSSITHRHSISIVACVIYVEIAIHLIHGMTIEDSIKRAYASITELNVFNECADQFNRMFSTEFSSLSMNDIQSSGYVVHTLEASLWCILNTNSYSKAVLQAVNLGDDTDTTAAVTGGIAGIIYGLEQIPQNWINQISKLAEIVSLCTNFEKVSE